MSAELISDQPLWPGRFDLDQFYLIRKTLGINLKLTIIHLTKEIVQSVIMFGYLNVIIIDFYFSIIFLVLSVIKKKISNMNNCDCGSLTKFQNGSKFDKKYCTAYSIFSTLCWVQKRSFSCFFITGMYITSSY